MEAEAEAKAFAAAHAGRLAGMDLDQYPAVVELDQLGIGAHVEGLADPALGQRVERFSDLGVVVAVDFDRLEHRDVVGPRDNQQPGCLLGGEHLGWAGAGGAVDPLPGDLGAPRLRCVLRGIQIGEGFPVPEVATHILNGPLNAGFVLR